MQDQMYAWGDWTDSNGSVHRMRYKTKWGDHEFTDEEQNRLLSGDEISFKYNGKFVTGHFQYYFFNGQEYFGFKSNYPKNEYDLSPTYKALPLKSTFSLDLQRENDIMAEYMRTNYYGNLFNKDKTRVLDYQRITDVEEQKRGIDVTYTQNGTKYFIDEKAQMDYIYNDEPLPTFSLEILNGSSGAIGWFINKELKTQYYMFIWPHAERKPLTVANIEYAYFALVNKEKLQIEVEKRFQKSPSQLLEYARRLTQLKMGQKICDQNGTCIGYRYKEDGFDDYGYLYYTLSKQEQPVNLIVRRSWLEEVSETHGKITGSKEEFV